MSYVQGTAVDSGAQAQFLPLRISEFRRGKQDKETVEARKKERADLLEYTR